MRDDTELDRLRSELNELRTYCDGLEHKLRAYAEQSDLATDLDRLRREYGEARSGATIAADGGSRR